MRGTASSDSSLVSTAYHVTAWNGVVPWSSSKSTMPVAQTSVRTSSFSSRACSGDM